MAFWLWYDKDMKAREWLEKAKREKWALGAFNVGNLETFKAIALAAAKKKSPVIIETSPGETSWMEAKNIVDLAKNYSDEYQIPILINLDHAGTLDECLKGIEAGYDLIHFDGSKMPFEKNLEISKQVVEQAHKKGILVEGEFDHISGSSEVHSGSAKDVIKNIPMTDPELAQKFVRESGVDILAAFFGNVHGVFDLGGENLNIDLLREINKAVPCFLSLHGGSGIDASNIRQAVSQGIVKVNINTEMRQAFRDSLEESLENNPDEVAMYKVEGPVIEAVQRVVEGKIELFGSDGKVLNFKLAAA